MLQREQMLSEQRQRIIKHSDKKFWFKFSRMIEEESVIFKIWIDCSSWDDPLTIDTVKTLINKLYPNDSLSVNNSNYHLTVDALYENLATVYPDKSIWIEMNHDNFGLLAKYETRTPSTLLKI